VVFMTCNDDECLVVECTQKSALLLQMGIAVDLLTMWTGGC
jgi:hypothetical protein